jgi:hypothetical protein
MPQSEVLSEIFSTRLVRDPQGRPIPVHSEINPTLAGALYRTVLAEQPSLVLEIGMAYGVSSLAILSALAELGGDRKLISIDPFQDSEWQGAGRECVKRAGFAHLHQLVQEPDYFALPRLLRDKVSIDFAYIDGMHTFDYVLLDGFYIDKLLKVDGVVGFNDCGFRSIHKYLKFFVSHRKYEELNVGLKADYRGRNPLVTASRILTGRSNTDRYFRKKANWEPSHNFFKQF